MTPVVRLWWTTVPGCMTALAPSASMNGMRLRVETRTLSPFMSSSVRTGLSRVSSTGASLAHSPSTFASYSASSAGRARRMASVHATAVLQMPG